MNRELADRFYAALAAGDRDAVLRLLGPDFSVTFTAGLPQIGGTHHGAAAVDDGWWVIGRLFSLRVEPSEWVPCADGRLLVVGHYVGRARATKAPVNSMFMHLISGDGERLTRLVQVTDSAQWVAALSAAPPA